MCFDQVLCGAYASLGCELLGGCGQHSLLREERGGRCSRTTAGCNEDQWLREPSQQASGCDAGPCLSTGDSFLRVRSPALSRDRADIPQRVSVFQKHSKPGPALILCFLTIKVRGLTWVGGWGGRGGRGQEPLTQIGGACLAVDRHHGPEGDFEEGRLAGSGERMDRLFIYRCSK